MLLVNVGAKLVVAALVLVAASCGRVAVSPVDASPPGATDDATTPVVPNDAGGGDVVSPGPDGTPTRDAQSDEAARSDGGPDVRQPTDAQLSAKPLAPCVDGSYVFAVGDSKWFPSVSGPQEVTELNGTWSGSVTSESLLQVGVDGTMNWQLTAASNFIVGEAIGVGTYDAKASNRFPNIQVVVGDSLCGGPPSGTFTIVEFAASPGDEATLSRLLMWFDLTCDGLGELTGCVSYGR